MSRRRRIRRLRAALRAALGAWHAPEDAQAQYMASEDLSDHQTLVWKVKVAQRLIDDMDEDEDKRETFALMLAELAFDHVYDVVTGGEA
jgi:hypothetical protein